VNVTSGKSLAKIAKRSKPLSSLLFCRPFSTFEGVGGSCGGRFGFGGEGRNTYSPQDRAGNSLQTQTRNMAGAA